MQIFVILSLVFVISLLFTLQRLCYRKYALTKLSAKLAFSKKIAHCGDELTITEMIRNEKRLPLPWVCLKFVAPAELLFLDLENTSLSDLHYREDILSLGGWKQNIRHIKVRCLQRGYYTFRRFNISTRDLFLTSILTQNFTCDSTLHVLPKPLKHVPADMLYRMTCGDVADKKSPLVDPFFFAGIRSYQPWDSYKNINWLSTAKQNQLMVNTHHRTVQRDVTLCMNVTPFAQRRDDDLTEMCIRLAYTLAAHATHAGLPVRLLANSFDVLGTATLDSRAGSSRHHLEHIGILLSRIDLSKGAHPFVLLLADAFRGGAATTHIIISTNADVPFQKYLLSKRSDGFYVAWILAYARGMKPPSILPSCRAFTRLWEVQYEA